MKPKLVSLTQKKLETSAIFILVYVFIALKGNSFQNLSLLLVFMPCCGRKTSPSTSPVLCDN